MVKVRISDESVDTWLESLDDDRADDVRALDAIIREAIPAPRVLWVGKFWGGTDQTIIGYGDLYQPRPKGEVIHWFVAGLALQKQNISIYVNAVKDGKYIGQAYGKQLGKVKLGSASIGFKRLADLDVDVLRQMLKEANELATPASQ